MDQERQRIQDDLRGHLDGEVRCDDLMLQLYANDASIFEIRPLGVVRPRGVSDVVACVKYASENGIPLHARGAGTGLAGESLGPGLVIDFSHGMRRILEIDESTARIQPGVVHATLNQQLAEQGRLFGPDPATGSVSTMGSVLALDAAGSHWMRYGSARQHIQRLEVVLADGEVVQMRRRSVARKPVDNTPREEELVHRVSRLLEREQPLINEHQPKTCVNRSGYQLQGVLEKGDIDLTKLFAGSEGTLGFITEAVVTTDPLPAHRGLVLAFFDRLEKAAVGAQAMTALGVSACDLMDRRLLSMARESDPRYDVVIPAQAEAMLLIECEDEDPSLLRDRLRAVVARLQRRRRLAFETRTALENDEVEFYWMLVRRVVPTLYRLKKQIRALPFVEDIAVPPKALADFLVRVQNVFKSHQVTASVFAHAGHGQLHIRPFLDLSNPDHVQKLHTLANDLYTAALDIDGTISGEHGDGLSRTWFVRKQFGPLYRVFEEIKTIFDPQTLLNPDKVISDKLSPTDYLRPVTTGARPFASDTNRQEHLELDSSSVADSQQTVGDLVPLQLAWNAEELAYQARSCNGCGRCRTQLSTERMCPIFRFAPREEATPRAKANLLRGLLTGNLPSEYLSSDELKAVSDLCINCHQCRLECPASVDIPKLVTEARAQYVATNGLSRTDWVMSRLDWFSQWGSRFAPLANWAIGNRAMRWLMQYILGISAGRKLPRFARTSFMRWANRERLTQPPRSSGLKVVYFVDTYANWHDVELAMAVVDVLKHNGISVFVPPDQLGSGMAKISLGAIDDARRVATRNVPLLANKIRQGYHVVTSEPSAALALTHEYPALLDDEDAHLVAANCSEIASYLWKQHQRGQLELDFNPINATVAYHQPCHTRALQNGSPSEHLLRLIPGLTVRTIEAGCSGMAGTFGVKRENYRSSLRAGRALISALRETAFQVGTTECSACKIQMEQGTTKPTIHPLKLLAHSYGLKPEFASLLTARGEELIVT